MDTPLSSARAVYPLDDSALAELRALGGEPVADVPWTSIPERFHAVVAAHAQAPAVEWDGGTWSYGALAREASAVAAWLEASGVSPGERVGLAAERGPALVAALLGILEAGAAYAPFDPAYPRERLELMMGDARVRRVITTSAADSGLPRRDEEVARLVLEAAGPTSTPETHARKSTRPSAAAPHAESPAYIMYTSGSTGTPKGVVVPHRAVLRLVDPAPSRGAFMDFPVGDRVLLFAPTAFDASTLELFGPLLNGGTVVLHPPVFESIGALGRFIEERRIDTCWLTAALFHALVDGCVDRLAGVRQLLSGGDVLSSDRVRRALSVMQRPGAVLINGYGPTENTTFTTCAVFRAGDPVEERVPIGRPIPHTAVRILGPDRELLPRGEVGELWAGGTGVALGYHERPELDAERFVALEPGGPRWYRTGDRASWREDGQLAFLGRSDGQVKIRGHRVELGEVEAALRADPAVSDAVVGIRRLGDGDATLIAWCVLAAGGATDGVRRRLYDRLPEAMVPGRFVVMDALPANTNGKIDRAALPEPGRERPDLAVAYAAPRPGAEAEIARAMAAILDLERVGRHDSFFELGGTSLQAVRLVERLRGAAGDSPPAASPSEIKPVADAALLGSLSIVQLFDAPTPAGLASRLQGRPADGPRTARPVRSGAIAIVGMAGRFPGASSPAALWDALLAGRELVTAFEPDVDAPRRGEPGYVAVRGLIEGGDCLDAAFFAMTPRQAEAMDPQHRVFLETAWEALESAGYVPETAPGDVGIFGGSDFNTYRPRYLERRPDLLESMGALPIRYGNDKDYVPITVAHRLDLRGPAVSVHTACSTSLVAVVQAVNALRAGQCELALAGGVNVVVPQRSGHVYSPGDMFSSDGHTRTFDADATGTVFSDGCAIVVLRRLEDAVAAGDTVHAVITGVGISNDGAEKASFTAPSVAGQARAIRMAIEDAGLDSREIDFVECHGTATPLGDPIEVAALAEAYRRTAAGPLPAGSVALGSVKSNVGHTTAAAGATGLIKAALAVSSGVLPESLFVSRPNPRIPFADTPFYPAAQRVALRPEGRPARGGVSSLGVGGTNAHVIVEAPPAPQKAPCVSDRASQLLVLSARSPAALDALAARLSAALDRPDAPPLDDVAFTLGTGRRALAHRRAFVVDPGRHADVLSGASPERTRSSAAPRRQGEEPPRVAVLFPGQGTQAVDMGRALYRSEPIFRQVLDAVFAAVPELADVLYPAADPDEAARRLRDTAFAQPAIFAVELGLASLLASLGVSPTALVGHSVGEFAAAVTAGVMRLEDAARLVALRGRLMSALPPGRMLAVRLGASDVQALLPQGLDLACSNAPSLSVVAGPANEIADFAAHLAAQGVKSTELVTSHAFHSRMMDPVVAAFREAVAGVSLARPTRTIISTASGRVLTPEEATEPAYWAGHVRATVRFSEAIATLMALPEAPAVLVEAGPRATAATFARQQLRGLPVAVATLLDPTETVGEHAAFLRGLGELWCAGVPLDQRALYAAERRRRVPLPTYPFERVRHFADPRPSEAAPPPTALAGLAPAPPPAVHTPPPGIAAHEARSPLPAPPHGAAPMSDRPERLERELTQLVAELSGHPEGDIRRSATFAEHGFDSLFLTQLAQDVGRRWGQKIAFRDLAERLSTVSALAKHLDSKLPAEAPPAQATAATAPVAPQAAAADRLVAAERSGAPPAGLEALLHRQLDLIAEQLRVMQGFGANPPAPAAAQPASASPAPAAPEAAAQRVPSETLAALAAVSHATQRDPADTRPAKVRAWTDLPKDCATAVRALVEATVARTPGSKRHVQEHRLRHADPRTAAGFNPVWKEMVYPLVVARSLGARLWDVDGNEYIDLLNGFGPNFLGHSDPEVVAAIKEQLDRGFEVGPQTPLAGEAAELVCRLTGFDRASFTCTGSEAVQAAIRCARTFTGREKFAIFTKDYHGNFDEVLVRAANSRSGLKTLPSAPGIPVRAVGDVIVLEYGHDASLEALRLLAPELAAVIVEPVQSRRPELQPKAFLETLRKITKDAGTMLVFDEVVTGFRCHPGGAQAHFGIEADLATYGKVVAGGMPIGIVAGRRPVVDTFDGGPWQYGDDSLPEAGVTFFAGTFVRHPLAMAAVHATLTRLEREGPELQARVSRKTADFARRVNVLLERFAAPYQLPHFGSQLFLRNNDSSELGGLLWYHLRNRGVHIQEGFPSYFTACHGDAEVDTLVAAFEESLEAMADGGLLPPDSRRRKTARDVAGAGLSSVPPVPGARLGKDPQGRPGWYAPDPAKPGQYVKVG